MLGFLTFLSTVNIGMTCNKEVDVSQKMQASFSPLHTHTHTAPFLHGAEVRKSVFLQDTQLRAGLWLLFLFWHCKVVQSESHSKSSSNCFKGLGRGVGGECWYEVPAEGNIRTFNRVSQRQNRPFYSSLCLVPIMHISLQSCKKLAAYKFNN